MGTVFDTAQYILEKLGPVSAMKLQKLCYYCQAWSLVWDDNELFSEEFHAWENGPVCKELFNRTRGQFKINVGDEHGDSSHLSENQKETIDLVLDYYAPHDAQWLSQLSHMEKPWKMAREGMVAGEVCDNIVTKESMAEYYAIL